MVHVKDLVPAPRAAGFPEGWWLSDGTHICVECAGRRRKHLTGISEGAPMYFNGSPGFVLCRKHGPATLTDENTNQSGVPNG